MCRDMGVRRRRDQLARRIADRRAGAAEVVLDRLKDDPGDKLARAIGALFEHILAAKR
jgi:hypothetical protein